ncbi:uncharacterized protein LOC142340841 [Convolutriloba macropyga]|uniref:uncharacterized protein LOC142340841 n=1 Tax=Convolutriloba macropyga TaxID=536237 RepID=UPI003F521CE2
MVNLTNEEANSCEASKFKKATLALFLKQLALFSASAGIFLYNCLRSWFKLRNIVTNRVFLLPIDGVVDLWTHLVDLIRENIIGLVSCSVMTSRFLLRMLVEYDGVQMYDNSVLTAWIIYFTITCFYNF